MLLCVCILGIDSRYNDGCTELAKYLFYGLYGRNQLNLEQVLEEFPDEMLDGEFFQVLLKRFLNHFFVTAFVFIYSDTLFVRPPRCDPADQGGVCSSVLQPTELQLPVALRVPLEEPASLLHDRGRG